MSVAEYFDGLAKEHHRNAKTSDASEIDALEARWRVMTYPIAKESTVLDVGCGWGGFGEWLKLYKPDAVYTGVDVSAKAIAQTRKLAAWHGDILDINVFRWDYVVGQGLFYKQKDFATCLAILDKMWELATKAVVITTILEGQEGELSFNIPFLLTWVQGLGCEKWTLRHDYLPNDVCLYLYK